MAIIKSEDLFPFDEYSARMKGLSDDTAAVAQSLIAWFGRIRSSVEEAQKEVAPLREGLKSISLKDGADRQVTDYIQKIGQVGERVSAARQSLASLTEAQQLNSKVVTDLTTKLATLYQKYNALDESSTDYQKQQRTILNEVKLVTRSIDAQSKSLQVGKTALDAADRSYNALNKQTKAMLVTLRAMPEAYEEGTGKINEQNKAAVALNAQYQKSVTLLKQIESGQGVHNRNVGNYPKSGSSSALNTIGDLTGLGGAASAAGVGALVASAGGAILEIGTQYEKLNLLTENALNNNKKAAAEAGAIIRDFADHSPLEMDKVTEAFNRLVDIGIIPTKEQLTEISDMAISKNKDITDYVELIADAQQGQFDRLAEFSINAQKSGDKIKFTFKGVTTEVDNNSKAISDYLIGLGKVNGVMGATEKLAASVAGRWSTLKDTTKGIASDLYQTFLPAINAVLGALNWGIGVIGGFVKGLKQMAQEQGILATIFKFTVNPFAATTEAYKAKDRAPASADPNKTPELDKLRKEAEAKQKINDAQRKKDEAAAKAEKDKDKVLNETLANRKAANETELAQLVANKQDGLITEREFIEKRKKITLAGIAERQAILEKAHKRESDDYQKLTAEKYHTETDYKRDLLKVNLSESKSDASKAIAGLGHDREDGTISDLDFTERKRGIMVASLNEQKQILIAANQGQSKLANDIAVELLEVDRVYYRERAKINADAWKNELAETVEGLKAIDQTISKDYADRLSQIDLKYSGKIGAVQTDMAGGKLNPSEGDKKIHELRLEQLKEELEATQAAYQKDDALSKALVDSKIQHLEDLKAHGMLTPAEIEAANEKIRQLQKERDQDVAENKKQLDDEVAKNAISRSNEEADAKKKNAALLREQQEKLADLAIEIATTAANGIFSIEQQKTQTQLSQLEKQKDYELQLAGDNADARAAIEQKFDRESRELKRKQDIQNRAQALFNIGVNTAVAVVKTLAEGGPLGIPLAIAVGALGAVQAGIVLAQPLPAYKTGKRSTDAYEGRALAGEAGSELWIGPDGSVKLLDRPTLINTQAGDTIYTASQTSTILSNWKKHQGVALAEEEISLNRSSFDAYQSGRQPEMKVLMQQLFNPDPGRSPMTAKQFEEVFLRVWQTAPRHETIIDFEGLKRGMREGNNRHEYLEKRHKW